TGIIEMAMRVNEAWQESLLAKIDYSAGVARFDLLKLFNIDDSVSGNRDRAILNRRSIHRYNGAGANDHSPFTSFRHAATKRLHGSWQSSGTVAGVANPG